MDDPGALPGIIMKIFSSKPSLIFRDLGVLIFVAAEVCRFTKGELMVERTVTCPARDDAFQRDLIALIPHLRSFARSLTGQAASADDLTQEAIVRAWMNRSTFQAGTNMKAWSFMILRNAFYQDIRRSWRSVAISSDDAENALTSDDNPLARLQLNELRQALNNLPLPQREAIILVGAGGLSYADAANICRCPVGTLKSRVNRGREALVALLDSGSFERDNQSAATASVSLMADFERLRVQRCGRQARSPKAGRL